MVPRRTTTARGTSHQRPSGALLPVETGKKAAHTSTPMGPLGAHLEAKPPERAPGTEPDARPEHAPALSNFSQWRATQRAPEAGSGNTARRPVRGGGHRGGLGTPLEGTYFQAELGNAMCVQSLDDSLNSAIHITYRISLRSSSLREPRYPSAGVVVRFVGWARAAGTRERTAAAPNLGGTEGEADAGVRRPLPNGRERAQCAPGRTCPRTPPPPPPPRRPRRRPKREGPRRRRRGLRWRGGRAEAGPPHVRGEAQPEARGPGSHGVRNGYR